MKDIAVSIQGTLRIQKAGGKGVREGRRSWFESLVEKKGEHLNPEKEA